MNALPTSPAVRRLALGVSRTCGGGVRPTCRAVVPPVSTAATITTTPRAMAMRISRHTRKLAALQNKPVEKKPTKRIVIPPHPMPDHHGEAIWIHNHTYDGHVLLSFDRVMDADERLRQMPYTGKKLVPAKLRKDYWEPMALIRFPTGLGEVGRSVYQKLRELKKRHELEWGRDDPEEEKRMLSMNKHDRGKAINDQRANVVADMAAVLGGYGRGNLMWMLPWTKEWEGKGVLVKKSPVGQLVPLREEVEEADRWRLLKMGVQVQTAGGNNKFVDLTSLLKNFVVMPENVEKEKKAERTGPVFGGPSKMGKGATERLAAMFAAKDVLNELKALHKVRVYWNEHNVHYKGYAGSWTDNVEHVDGLDRGGLDKGRHTEGFRIRRQKAVAI